mmetsp:Transcript_8961/g.12172  ORF Transcript_8961/g.12172 Transcript_8961/m.12172 type:complete len:213 (-) Transcript_8961:73-711(-)
MGDALSLQHMFIQTIILLASLGFGFSLVPQALTALDVSFDFTVVLLLTVVIHTLTSLLIFSFGTMRNVQQHWILRLAKGFIGSLLGLVVFYVVAVLYGAPLLHLGTLAWSALLSSLVVIPPSCALPWEAGPWRKLFAQFAPEGEKELSLCLPSHGAMVGAWVGAWTIPLDWDRPWQIWPIPCALGAVGGYGIGLLAACLACGMYNSKKEKNP